MSDILNMLPDDVSSLIGGQAGSDPDASRWESKTHRRDDGQLLDEADFHDRLIDGAFEVPGGRVFESDLKPTLEIPPPAYVPTKSPTPESPDRLDISELL
jgi:hypothetical protein